MRQFNSESIGEGGTFALYQGLCPSVDYDYEIDRNLTYQEHKSDLAEKLRRTPAKRKISQGLRVPLLIWVRKVFTFSNSLSNDCSVFSALRKCQIYM